ncbi:hypothetical protein GF358_00405 [Candidatus Woesearchaeota archaeon]|nr:hypothetical protein [Candidatus Woesearchaeota archaeon]
MKKKKINYYFQSLSKYRILNVRTIILTLIFLIFLIRFKKIFFIGFFIIINLIFVYLETRTKINIPLKVIDFGVFMLTYVYGPIEGLMLSVTHIILLPFANKMSLYRILINLFFLVQFVIIPLLRNIDIKKAGIVILILKFIVDLFINLVIFGDIGTPKKSLRRIIDFTITLGLYIVVAEPLYRIMKI